MGRSRRAYLAQAAGAFAMIASGLSAKSVLDYLQDVSEDTFPPPGIVATTDPAWGSVSASDDGSVTLTFDEAVETVVRRVFDPEDATTIDTERIDVPGDEVELKPTDPGVIDMIYRRTADDSLEYLLDLPVSSQITTSVRDAMISDGSQYYQREFGDHAIEVTFNLWSTSGPATSFYIPYSLYFDASETNPTGPVPTAVSASDNGFDRYDHDPLVTAVEEMLEAIEDVDHSAYWTVASIGELVQSIPHMTDWDSLGQLHYVRTPAEMFVELTADCKDASVLLFDLLEHLDYDPVFILLIGNVATTAIDEADKDTSKTADDGGKEMKVDPEVKEPPDDVSLYPNHIAVGVPLEQLEPLPDLGDEDIAVFERNGTEFAYLESTERALPGLYRDTDGGSTHVVYTDRRDMIRQLLPF